MDNPVNEENQNVEAVHQELEAAIADPVTKSHPESVPWNQYVGLKEKTRKIETRLITKVNSLEEQIKKAGTASGSSEEVTKLKTELDATKAELTKANDAIKAFNDKSLTDKRTALKGKIPEDKLVTMSDKELDAANLAISSMGNSPRPKPDMGSGGGSTPLTGSPIELARQAYATSNKSK
jgi:uncharacterized protein YdcH (DUF465 family)